MLLESKVVSRLRKNRSQHLGFGIQEARERGQGVRANLNFGLWIVTRLLTSCHRRMPAAHDRLPLKSRRSGKRDLRYSCFLPTADCRLPTVFEGGRMKKAPRRHDGSGHNVT